MFFLVDGVVMETASKPLIDTRLANRFLKQVRKRNAAKMVGRMNLSDRFAFSIDKPGTQVFDDAISVSRRSGIWRLDVHVADVATWCEHNSALDRIVNRSIVAQHTSPRLVLPMKTLKGGLSLDAGKPRFAITVSMWLDATATRFTTHVYRSLVTCNANTDFATADQLVADPSLADNSAKRRLLQKLNMLQSLATQLSKRQLASGLLPMDSNEVSGANFDNVVRTLMLESGFALAKVCKAYKADVWYRTQAPPSKVQWRTMRSYFAERLIELPYQPDAAALALAMESVMSDRMMREECRRLYLQNTQSAADVIMPKPHFALGERLYVHATSPLRIPRNLENQKAIRRALVDFGGPLCIGKG